MSEPNNTNGNVPSVGVAVDMYNSYGLATQGFVWAAISSVSGSFGEGRVKTVNGYEPDENGNVSVTSISSLSYSDDINQINADRTAIIDGEEGHRILSDIDESNIRSYVKEVSGNIEKDIKEITDLIPSNTSSSNKLTNEEFVKAEVSKANSVLRGSFATWFSVPNSEVGYLEDKFGNKKPKETDYIIVTDASETTYSETVGQDNLIGKVLGEDILTYDRGTPITPDINTDIFNAGITSVQIERTGTWRFVYNGNWDEKKKTGWNAEYQITTQSFTQVQMDAINSGITAAILSNIRATSGEWDRAYSTLTSLSARWANATSEVEAVSAKYADAYTSISSTSANWNSVYSSVSSASAGWDSTKTKVETESPIFSSTHTAVSSTSGQWNDAFSYSSTTSANNASVYATVNSTSGNWDNTYSTVNASSGNWSSVFASVMSHSGAWDATSGNTKEYTDLMATSALTTAKDYTDTELAKVSSVTNSVYASVSSTSGNWDKVYSSVNAASGNWDNAYSTVNASSGNWSSVFTSVMAHSAAWDATSGNTKEYTDLMATSALTTAEDYTDTEVAKVASTANSVYSSVSSTSANWDNAYSSVNTTSGNWDSVYSSVNATSANWESAYTTVSSTSGEIDSKFTAIGSVSGNWNSVYASVSATSATWDSMETNANTYSDTVAFSALTGAKEYADSTASAAETNANAYTDTVSGLLNKTVTYSVPFTSTEGISYYSTLFANPNNGDVIILKKELFNGATENFRFTSFTYYNGEWCAMNGDYDTKNVFFSENLTTTFDIGKEVVDKEIGYKVLETKGKSINTVFSDIFKQENNPEVTLPSITKINTSNFGSFEVGTTLAPSLTIETEVGSYTYGPTSTSEISSYTAYFNNKETSQEISTGRPAQFESITLTDEMSAECEERTLKVIGHFTDDTVVPVTNFNNEVEELKITAGDTDEVYSVCTKSFRKAFAGHAGSRKDESQITSTFVRGLQFKSDHTPVAGEEITADYPNGAYIVLFAYPKWCGEAKSIVDNTFHFDIKDAFELIEMEVEGNNNRYPTTYYVYYKNAATANDTPKTYTLTIKE